MCILDIVLSVVGTIKGFESFETFFECVGSLGASEWGSRPERIERSDGSGLAGNEGENGPARRRCGNMGGTGSEGRQNCSILLFDNELSFDISKQKIACQGSKAQIRTNMARCRRHCTRIPPIKRGRPGDLFVVCNFAAGQGRASGRKVLQGSVSLVSQSIRAMHRAGSWRGSAAPGGRGRSLSPPRAPGGAGVGPG